MTANPMDEELRIGVFVCDCGFDNPGSVYCQAVAGFAAALSRP